MPVFTVSEKTCPPVAEVVPDLIGQELQREGYVREAVTLEEPHDVLHARQVHDGDHGFGVVAGGRPQARPAYGHGDGLYRIASGRRNVGADFKPAPTEDAGGREYSPSEAGHCPGQCSDSTFHSR